MAQLARRFVLAAFVAMTAAIGFSSAAVADGHSKNIIDTAIGAGSFNTLVAAV